MVLVLAQYLCEFNDSYLRRKHYLILGSLTLFPMILITLQGDLGTALMYLPILLGILVVSGLRMRFLLVCLLCSVLAAPVGWAFLKDYQKQRILVTLDPELDPQGIGYQSRQSQIAIGSGGLFGKGLGHGLQSQLGFVPEIHTDFIFAILAEEIGFVGSVFILMLYLLVLVRLVHIAESAQDRLGILIVTGIASLIFFHVGINVGMTFGLVPPDRNPTPPPQLRRFLYPDHLRRSRPGPQRLPEAVCLLSLSGGGSVPLTPAQPGLVLKSPETAIMKTVFFQTRNDLS